MQGQISSAKLRRLLLLPAAVVGTLLLPCASASAKTVPELTLSLQVTGTVKGLFPVLWEARAIQPPATTGEVREAIAITSSTPSVCVILGYVWKPGEELPAEQEMVAEAWHFGVGTCTIVASVKATSTTEAATVSRSETAGTPFLTELPPQPTLPELTLQTPTKAYLFEALASQAQSSRPRLTVSTTTPSVCGVLPRSGRARSRSAPHHHRNVHDGREPAKNRRTRSRRGYQVLHCLCKAHLKSLH